MTTDEVLQAAKEAGFGINHAEADAILFTRFAALVAAAEREAAQRAFWDACRPHGKVGEVVYTTYKHLRARSEP